MSSKNSLIKGAAVLVAANFIVKFIGVIYKIPLGNILSGDGMAYFTAAFDIYLLLLAFSTAGLPVAVSKMVSESYALKRYSEVNKIFKTSLLTFIGIGFLGSILMYFGAGIFANFIEMPLAELSIKALSPAVFFFSIVAIFRGYFQGMQNMNPTALTQVLEAICKLCVGIGLAFYLFSLGSASEILSAGAILGTTSSTLVAALLLILIYFSKINRKKVEKLNRRGGQCRSSKKIIRDLVIIAVPVTIGSFVVNLTGFLDLFFIMNRLIYSGVSEEMATIMSGSYKGYAYTISNLPPSIISSVNVTLIPVISAAYVLGDRERLQYIINNSIKVITMFALPCAVGLMVLPNQILTMFYPSAPEEVAIATPLLFILGIATFWITLSSFTTIVLQSTGKMSLPILAIVIGGIVKLIASYILIGIPSIGIKGAPISTILCYMVIVLMNLYNIKKYTQTNIFLKQAFVKPFISSVLMGVIAFSTYALFSKISFIGGSIATILAIIIAAISYGILIIFTGAFTQDDLKLIPGGNKLSRLFAKK